MVPDSKRECSDTIPPEFLERVTALEEKSLSYSRTIPTEPDPCTKKSRYDAASEGIAPSGESVLRQKVTPGPVGTRRGTCPKEDLVSECRQGDDFVGCICYNRMHCEGTIFCLCGRNFGRLDSRTICSRHEDHEFQRRKLCCYSTLIVEASAPKSRHPA